MKADIYQRITDQIVTELEKGVKPWVRLWDPEKSGGPQAPFNPATGKRRNLGTFSSRPAAEKHERAVQYFKRH